MKYVAKIISGVVSVVMLQACDTTDRPTAPNAADLVAGSSLAVGSTVSGATLLSIVKVSGDVDPQIPLFASAIGEPDNGSAPGHHEVGRREINWDGVPAAFTNNDTFPEDFFNVNSPRGAIYEAEGGTGLRVSDNDFADVNPTYGVDLEPFSLPKMFTTIGSNVFELEFRIPGTNIPAVVASFGAVIDDVDKKDVTRVIFYDKNDKVIANVGAPLRRAPDEYSLVGVTFSKPVIAKVVIIMGDAPIGVGVNDVSSGGTKDIVVLDDLIYSEPQPIK